MAALRAVSLFSNCGAGDLGFRRAGFHFEVMAELESDRLAVAKLNHPGASTVKGDLRNTLPQVVAKWRATQGDTRPALLAACPPCQGMSSGRSDRGTLRDPIAGDRDPRNLLVQVVLDATLELQPRVLVVENVQAFLTRQVSHPSSGASVSAATVLIDGLAEEYHVFPIAADLADFGIAQSRKRCFLTFFRNDEPCIELLASKGLAPYPRAFPPGQRVSLRTALDAMALPPLDASSHEVASDSTRALHRVPVWNEQRYQMIASIAANSGRTAWQNSECLNCDTSTADPDAAVCSECDAVLPRPVVIENNVPRLISGFRRSSYGRMDPFAPAATVTTASGRIGSDNTIHPSQNRVMSMLECQLLQTIPADFKWGDTLERRGHTVLRAMIGEAVPPHFTMQHGKVLNALLMGRRPQQCMNANDERVRSAIRSLRRAQSESAANPRTAAR